MPRKLRVVSPPPAHKLARLVEDYLDDCRARGRETTLRMLAECFGSWAECPPGSLFTDL